MKNFMTRQIVCCVSKPEFFKLQKYGAYLKIVLNTPVY